MPARSSDTTLRVVTANRLDDGAIVYLAPSALWSTRIADAVVASGDDEMAPLMAEVDRAVAARIVVSVYAIPVDVGDEGIVPLGQKERIRAAGPTIPWGVTVTAAQLEA
jgi:hypothetical protein